MHTHNPDLHRIDLTRIDEGDTTYCITADPDTERMAASLAAVGLLNPPLLTPAAAPGNYTIVCGSRRIMAARHLGWRDVPAVIMTGAPLDLLRCSLWDNLAHRRLHVVEQAAAVSRLLGQLPVETVRTEWLPRFDLRPSIGTLNRLRQIAALAPEIRRLLTAERITDRTALLLAESADDLQRALAPLFDTVQASASRQREIVMFCRDITRRDQVTTTDLLQRIHAAALCSDAGLSPGKRAERVWERLRAVRFPHLTDREARFATLRRQLQLPAGMRLEHPPYFEGGSYRLSIDIHETQAVPQQADAIARLLNDPTLQRMLHDDD